jgi:hypothetical protein
VSSGQLLPFSSPFPLHQVFRSIIPHRVKLNLSVTRAAHSDLIVRHRIPIHQRLQWPCSCAHLASYLLLPVDQLSSPLLAKFATQRRVSLFIAFIQRCLGQCCPSFSAIAWQKRCATCCLGTVNQVLCLCRRVPSLTCCHCKVCTELTTLSYICFLLHKHTQIFRPCGSYVQKLTRVAEGGR